MGGSGKKHTLSRSARFEEACNLKIRTANDFKRVCALKIFMNCISLIMICEVFS